MTALKRLCRCLKGRPRVVQCCPGPLRGVEVHVYVASDWAGCRKTRKSTNGGCLVVNGGCLRSWSTTQSVMALSSGEAEYYAALKGASVALGFQSMCRDLGDEVQIRLFIDSAAAHGIIGRRGLGKVRHLEVGYLWLQQLVAEKRVVVQKVKGESNPADLGTKHLKLEDLDKHLTFLSCFPREGRSSAVPDI